MVHIITLETETRAVVLRVLRQKQRELEAEMSRCDSLNYVKFSKQVFVNMVALRIELRHIQTAISALWTSRGALQNENTA